MKMNVSSLCLTWVMAAAGCNSAVVYQNSPLDGLDDGIIYVERESGSAGTDIYKLVYVVEVPPESAWAAGEKLSEWLSGVKLIDSVQATSRVQLPDDEVEQQLEIRLSDGTFRRGVLQLDKSKGLIDLRVDPSNSGGGHLAHLTIRIEPYRRHHALIEAEVQVDQSFARRLIELIRLPFDVLTGGGLDEELRRFCLHVVTRHREESRLVQSTRPPPSGRTHVVAIGVEMSNEDAGWNRIDYAEEDAESFFDWAERTYPREPGDDLLIRELIKTPDATDARISSVLHMLEDPREERVREGDTILFFFAGHIDFEEDRLDPGHQYLLTGNAQPGNLRATATKERLVIDTLRFSKASRCLFICDACYSGGMRMRWDDVGLTRVAARGPRKKRLHFSEPKEEGESKVAILAAAGAQERAFERSDLEHGVFTYFLLAGLEGKADANGDNFVSLGELKEWVTKQVRDLTDKKQTPHFRYSQTAEVRFEVVPAPPGELDGNRGRH